MYLRNVALAVKRQSYKRLSHKLHFQDESCEHVHEHLTGGVCDIRSRDIAYGQVDCIQILNGTADCVFD